MTTSSNARCKKVTQAINERLAKIKSTALHTPRVTYYKVEHLVSLGTLREAYRPNQTDVPSEDVAAYENGEFKTFHSHPSETVVIRGADNGIICVKSSLEDPSKLDKILELVLELPRVKAATANCSGVNRGSYLACHLCVWSPYAEEPFLSKEFRQNGDVAKQLREESGGLCDEMSDVFGRFFSGTYREFM